MSPGSCLTALAFTLRLNVRGTDYSKKTIDYYILLDCSRILHTYVRRDKIVCAVIVVGLDFSTIVKFCSLAKVAAYSADQGRMVQTLSDGLVCQSIRRNLPVRKLRSADIPDTLKLR